MHKKNKHLAMRLLLILTSALLLSACSMDRMLVRSSVPLLESGVEALNHETDLDLAEDSIPANLNMLQGMIKIDPENGLLRTYAAQAFYGLAYGFNEDNRPERASEFYLRGRQHGITALELTGVGKLEDNTIADFNEAVSNMRERDVAAMFWTASCWAKWIDMHRDDPAAIAQLPRATALMQRVLELDETFYYGGAHLFMGILEASKPRMAGGDLNIAREHFLKAMELGDGKFLMTGVYYADYYAKKAFDRELFISILEDVLKTPVDIKPELTLLNAVAQKRALKLISEADDYF